MRYAGWVCSLATLLIPVVSSAQDFAKLYEQLKEKVAIDAAALDAAVPSAPSSGLREGEALPVPRALPPGAFLVPLDGASAAPIDVRDDDGRITLMVREGSLRRVVSLIAETQKLNLVFAGPTDTLVTASFDRVPWQTVLDSVLSASGHVWSTVDNVLFISTIDLAQSIPPGPEGRQVVVFELDFVSALDVDQTIQGLLSPAGKSWVMESMASDNRRTREAVAVVDYPRFLQRINDFVCQADQPPRQVLIEAHILAVDLSDDCRHGVDFNNLISLPSAGITLQNIGFANAAASPAFFVDADGTGLDGLIEMLHTTSDAKTLASPRVHAVSGQMARIQIGGQLGFRVTTTTQTSSLESVQFLDVGVVLEVTPRITRDGRVLMKILPKVSTGEVNAETGLPSEETTQVETDVLVQTGQGMVIGGLIQERDSKTVSKIPLLGDIPYAGLLFQKRQASKQRTEIIVTLRPHVLPYEPVVQARCDNELLRTELPLTQGAICSFPRPFEPRMPDACDKPIRLAWGAAPCAETPPVPNPEAEPELVAFPPVGEPAIPMTPLAPSE